MAHPVLELIKQKVVLFDGAMGTMLLSAGLSLGKSPELWNLEQPSLVAEIHRRYYEAGSDVVHTNTFGGNPLKLANQGLSGQMELINLEAARIAKDVCPAGRFIAGDIGPSGKLLKPLGDGTPESLEACFREQAQALLKGGVDLISIETMFSLEEALAAIRGSRKAGSALVVASMTYNKTKKGFFTMMGESAKKCVAALDEAGADVIGSNCTLGSKDMIDLTREIRDATKKPILIQPNAGKPVTRKGVTVYEQQSSDFAQDGRRIIEAGAEMIGGCCGTHSDFIQQLKQALSAL